jgi:hypothetical protein
MPAVQQPVNFCASVSSSVNGANRTVRTESLPYSQICVLQFRQSLFRNKYINNQKKFQKPTFEIPVLALRSSVGVENSVAPAPWSVVFQSLCDLLSASPPLFCENTVCLPKSKWCPKSKVNECA